MPPAARTASMSVFGLDAGASSDPSVGIPEADGSASAATRADAAAPASVLARFATSSGVSAAGAPGDASRFAPVPTGIASSECGGGGGAASLIRGVAHQRRRRCGADRCWCWAAKGNRKPWARRNNLKYN